MTSLKSFIKAVRAAKTLADERAVIQKESAAIRTSFREDYTDHRIRRQNIAKLLYLFTLGERTHFGQVECLKLLGSPKYTDKRLGYLGTMLLLDENQEVITLVTNSLSNDLAHPNQYVVALALCTLANIASTEMARDLYADIEKIIDNGNPYLRKKAALCAMRIVSRVPDLSEVFIDRAVDMLSDKNHGVLLCAASLGCELCEIDPELCIPKYEEALPVLTKHLKTLSAQGYAPEHDVLGVSDPFLQIKLMKLLRHIGQGSSSASDQMSDVLAHIASTTDSGKNVGCAVLYQSVLTILGIEADSGLRVLGVNILGKFLTNKDNNTRYVALNTLLQVIEIEPTAVQRHRSTIVECLSDPDNSIRKRALELSYALITEQNVRVMVRELLTFLETADKEFRTNLVSQIAIAADRFAPNRRWHIDTLLRALKLAGSHATENVLSAFTSLVITAPADLQLYSVQKLFAALKKDASQEGLTIVAVWVLGEYGNILLQQGPTYQEEEGTTITCNETDIVSLMESIIGSIYSTDVVKEYVVNALIKLSVRMHEAREIERIRRLLEQYSQSLNVEVQQRVVEYLALFQADASVRKGVLESMPAPEFTNDLASRVIKKTDHSTGRVRVAGSGSTPRTSRPNANVSSAPTSSLDLLLDLTDAPSPAGGANGTSFQASKSNNDLLSDIFASSSTPATPAASATANILDLFGSTPSTVPTSSAPTTMAAAATQEPAAQSYEAFSDSMLHISFTPRPEGPGSCGITANFKNCGQASISGLSLQVAVPKSQKLQLQGLSSSTLNPGEAATQLMRVSGPVGAAVRLRLRVSYNDVQQQVDFSGFPKGLL